MAVTPEQCKCLAEDIAGFRAARYRPAEPGCYRAEDRRAAEAAIKAVLKPRRKRK